MAKTTRGSSVSVEKGRPSSREIDQLSDNGKKENNLGIGTPGLVRANKVRVSTTDMQNWLTGTRTIDGRARAGGRCEAQPGRGRAKRALEHVDDWKWMAKVMDWPNDTSNTQTHAVTQRGWKDE